MVSSGVQSLAGMEEAFVSRRTLGSRRAARDSRVLRRASTESSSAERTHHGQPKPRCTDLGTAFQDVSRKLFELDHRLVRIGRDRSSDICLDDRRVSAFHVQILKRDDGSYLAEDLNSYNKTWLNGVKLEPYVPTVLTDGSTIKVCDFTFVFRYEAVAVRDDSATSDLTILGSLEDMSSVSLSSRGGRSSVVLRGAGDQSIAGGHDRSQRSA